MRWCFISLAVAVVALTTTANSLAIKKRETGETLAQEEHRVYQWVDELSGVLNELKNRGAIASWSYASNITDENQKISNEVSAETAKEYKVNTGF